MKNKFKRQTKQMAKAEQVLGQSLNADVIAGYVTTLGITGTAKELGVSRGVLQYWMTQFGITTHYIALAPGDTLLIDRASESIGKG